MAKAKKRTMRMKKRYNTKSRKGAGPVFGVTNVPDDETKNINSLSRSNSLASTDTGRSSFDSDDLNYYPTEQSPHDLQMEYQSKCPKNFFGFKKSSPECKALEENYRQLRGDIIDEQKEAQGMVNYQGYAPPKKKWFGLFGGRRTKRRRSQKKRTTRRRKY